MSSRLRRKIVAAISGASHQHRAFSLGVPPPPAAFESFGTSPKESQRHTTTLLTCVWTIPGWVLCAHVWHINTMCHSKSACLVSTLCLRCGKSHFSFLLIHWALLVSVPAHSTLDIPKWVLQVFGMHEHVSKIFDTYHSMLWLRLLFFIVTLRQV